MDEAEIAICRSVVSSGQSARIFELVEAAFDHIALRVNRGIDRKLDAPVAVGGDQGHAATLLHIFTDEVGIIAFVGEQHLLPLAIREAACGHRKNIRLTSSFLSLTPAPHALGWTGLDELAFFVVSAPEPDADASLFSAAFSLTRKESEILDQMLINQDRERICRQLNISTETLRWHIKNILSKCGCSSGAELVNAARQNNLANCS